MAVVVAGGAPSIVVNQLAYFILPDVVKTGKLLVYIVPGFVSHALFLATNVDFRTCCLMVLVIRIHRITTIGTVQGHEGTMVETVFLELTRNSLTLTFVMFVGHLLLLIPS